MFDPDVLERPSNPLLQELDETGATLPAILDGSDAPLTHGELRMRVADVAGRLPPKHTGRRLVHVPLRPDRASVVAYLAVLEAGHVALVTQPGERAAAILERYPPDLAVSGDAVEPFTRWPERPRHLLHPSLALLLSTSGSTGSPKLVRLSREGVAANARSIAEALRLDRADRGLTSLPLHYCFGLSVLHSHLVAGAAVVLHEGSIAEPAAWRAVDEHGVTTLAVVPHGVELLETAGELERSHPSLRLLAQAGGRLKPELVERLAALGADCGFQIAVMYGQTEATARIAVLDPSLAAVAPDAVGTPVPGTTIRIDTSVPEAQDGVGEIVVRGPGVMLGYAEHPDDLALGATLDELRTGDLGRIGDDGQLRIVGRRAAFVKVLGLRIDLGAVERALEAEGLRACVAGDDAGLALVVEPGGRADVQRLRHLAAAAAGLTPASVEAVVAPVPRLPSGKPDRRAAMSLARAAGGVPTAAVEESERAIASAVAHVLGTDAAAVDTGRSFAQLGGDSLSVVQASVRLEAIAGPLPRGWQHRPLAELVALAERFAAAARRSRSRTIETSVLLRALAAVAITGSHAGLFDLQGGAHILLAAAGAGAAGFALGAPSTRGRRRAAARTIVAIAVPAALVALVGWLLQRRYDWTNMLLVHGFVPEPDSTASLVELWFVEVLVWSLVLLVGVLSIAPLARAWRREPWPVAAGIAALAVAVSRALPLLGATEAQGTLAGALWLVAIGIAAAHADAWPRRVATLALLLAGGWGLFPDDIARTGTVLVGVAVLVLVPRVPVPRLAVRPIALVAAASLHIYLVQFMILSVLEPDALETGVAIAAGVLLHLLADRPMRRLQDLLVPTDLPGAAR